MSYLFRGCETYIVREGYEGLVRGNVQKPKSAINHDVTSGEIPEELHDDDLVHNLRFGDGPLLREGQGDNDDHPHGKTLKGRYIIRVGWDDVRGWFAEVCLTIFFSQM